MRPTFLIIGAGKCGTTSLWAYLAQHPEIGMSKIKEPSYFSMDENWARGWAWYERLFSHCAGKKELGEASNSYSATETYPETVSRIAQNLPSVKVIYSVRHPVKRTESEWMDPTKRGYIGFTEFLRTDPIFFDKNNYLRTYLRYTDALGAENVLVLFYEDLCADPSAFVSRCLAFLDINPDIPLDMTKRHGVTAENRVFLPGIRRLKASRLYNDLSIYLPDSLKNTLKPLLSRTTQIARPTWSNVDYAWFREQFEEPSREFLETVDQRSDFWDW